MFSASTDVSGSGLHFVKRLLEDNPEIRMTLTDALYHPWLEPLRPHAGPTSRFSMDDIATTASKILRDVSMQDPLPDSMSMNLDPPPSSAPYHIPGAFPGGSQPESRVIQRRRKVIDDAREMGKTFEPAEGMLVNAQLAQQREEAFFSDVARPLKRKAGDGSHGYEEHDRDHVGPPPPSPMKLELDEEMAEDAPARLIRMVKKGKAAAVESPISQRGRGRGRGGKNTGPQVHPDAEETDGGSRVRRSTRLGGHSPVKTGRRV